MSAQFYSMSPMDQNAMGGTHLHTPQSVFQHTMSQTSSQQTRAPWLTMPQVPPMSIPWSMPSYQQPDLVRFTGEKPLQPFGSLVHHKRNLETPFSSLERYKRKLLEEPDIVNTRPNKQFITEEKMAQHFRGLHISPNATTTVQDLGPSTSVASTSSNLIQSDNLNLPKSLESEEIESQPRLVISEELKRLQTEPILPSSLLSKLERPSMALVLWEPPSKHLRILSAPRDMSTPNPSSDGNNNNGMSVESTNNNNNNQNNNNNNESIPDFNQTMDANINDPTLEPMDL